MESERTTDRLMAALSYSNERQRQKDAAAIREAERRANANTVPDVFELIAAIKDMHTHHDGGGACRECGQPHPCNTYAYVDGLLAARFEDDDEAGPGFPT